MVVYPEGDWYSGMTAGDVPEIVRSHFEGGQAVARLLNRDPQALRVEIESNKNRMLAALEARDAAGALPDDLNETIRSFQASRAILTAIELDAFTAVGEGASALRFSLPRRRRDARRSACHRHAADPGAAGAM
jgi:hypothetical protein